LEFVLDIVLSLVNIKKEFNSKLSGQIEHKFGHTIIIFSLWILFFGRKYSNSETNLQFMNYLCWVKIAQLVAFIGVIGKLLVFDKKHWNFSNGFLIVLLFTFNQLTSFNSMKDCTYGESCQVQSKSTQLLSSIICLTTFLYISRSTIWNAKRDFNNLIHNISNDYVKFVLTFLLLFHFLFRFIIALYLYTSPNEIHCIFTVIKYKLLAYFVFVIYASIIPARMFRKLSLVKVLFFYYIYFFLIILQLIFNFNDNCQNF
jgi:hypothetical protein